MSAFGPAALLLTRETLDPEVPPGGSHLAFMCPLDIPVIYLLEPNRRSGPPARECLFKFHYREFVSPKGSFA